MTDSFNLPPPGVNIFFSGQRVWIADYSGLPIETSLFGTDRFLKVTISGQPTAATLSLSGVSLASNVSGNVVYLTSGQNAVQNSGQVVYLASGFNEIAGSFTANVSGQPVNVSGNTVIALISGQTVVANVVTNISGQVVYLVSGQNNVQMSGQTVVVPSTSISGNVVVVPSTSISGNMVSVSGQAISVSGNAVRTSGDTAYLTSGQNSVFPFGFIDASGQWTALRVTQSGQGISGIPHKLPVTFSGDSIIGSVSGNMVSVSGQPVSVSGNAIGISGQAVLISGQTVVASVTTNISGQTVYLASGFNPVQLYALDQSGQQLMPLIVNQSGGNVLRVDAGSIQVSANVSGNVVYLVSGQNNVQMSGQVVLISGQTVVASVTTNISGQTVYLASGQNAVQMSGQAIRIADATVAEFANVLDTIGDANSAGNNGLVVAGYTLGYDAVQDAWPRMRVTASGQGISGIPHKLVVGISGDPVTVSGNAVQISGQAVLVSGQLVSVSGLVATSVSGNMVSVSGQPVAISGQFVDISGEIIQPRVPVQIRTRDTLLITGASGGVALASGDVLRVTVRNIGVSGTVMYVGGSGDYPWVASGQANFPFQSGRGFWLRDGDGITIQTSNMAFVRVVSHTSGEHVSYLGEQY